jgi:hypothetical protein
MPRPYPYVHIDVTDRLNSLIWFSSFKK